MHDDNDWQGEQATKEVTREEMEADFVGFDGRLRALLKFVKPAKWPLFHHPDTPTYYNGRICLLGDSAHASSPSQAAGAGQGLEDTLILSRILGLVKSADQLDHAIHSYDAVRRPRSQRVVQESREVGMVYFLLHPGFGDDLKKITQDANDRLPEIWYHDLERDIEYAQARFCAGVRDSEGKKSDTVTVMETPVFPAHIIST